MGSRKQNTSSNATSSKANYLDSLFEIEDYDGPPHTHGAPVESSRMVNIEDFLGIKTVRPAPKSPEGWAVKPPAASYNADALVYIPPQLSTATQQKLIPQWEQNRNNRAAKGSGVYSSRDTSWLPDELIYRNPEDSSESNKWVTEEVVKTPEQLIKERVDQALAGWPWATDKKRFADVVLLAPFKMNPSYKFKNDCHRQSQSLLFVKVLDHDYIRNLLFTEIFKLGHEVAWKFSAACQETLHLNQFELGLWDMTSGWFNKCEIPEWVRGEEEPGWVSNNLIIAPHRLAGREGFSYAKQAKNLYKMCYAFSNFASSLRNVQLHHIPLLSVPQLTLILPGLSNLTTLGIYNCPLIHIGCTVPILDILLKNPKGECGEVAFDFFPKFNAGPAPSGPWEYDPYCIGPYGPTWDNWNGDTCVSIWSLLARIIPRAQWQKIDFLSPHTQFRRWLEKSPCWEVEKTLELMFNPPPKTSLAKIACYVDFRKTHGHRSYHSSRPDFPRNLDWCTKSTYCGTCKENYMAIFFWYGDIKNLQDRGSPGETIDCMGCKLTKVLDAETDHYKQRKRQDIHKRWLWDSTCPRDKDGQQIGPQVGWITDLKKALVDFKTKKIEDAAEGLDTVRIRDVERLGYDKEFKERQKPFTPKELGKRGGFLRSPMCKENERLNWNQGRGDDHLPKYY